MSWRDIIQCTAPAAVVLQDFLLRKGRRNKAEIITKVSLTVKDKVTEAGRAQNGGHSFLGMNLGDTALERKKVLALRSQMQFQVLFCKDKENFAMHCKKIA